MPCSASTGAPGPLARRARVARPCAWVSTTARLPTSSRTGSGFHVWARASSRCRQGERASAPLFDVPAPEPILPHSRVLLRLPNWLGDLIEAEPLASALAAHVGPERLTLAGPATLLPILDGRLPGSPRLPLARQAEPMFRSMDRVEVAWLLHGSFRGAWAARRARVRRRIGFAKGARRWLLTDPISVALERGEVPRGLGRSGRPPRVLPRPFDLVCAELGLALGLPLERRRPRLEVTPQGAAAADERGVSGAGFVLLNVGARPGSAKGWLEPHWAQLAEELAQRGRDVVLVSGPGEEERLAAVARAVSGSGVQVLAGRTVRLPELVAWCARASLVVCADGGVRHVARAVGTPAVVLFGPTDPRHTASYTGDERHLRVPVSCGPCHQERCLLPPPQKHRCMRLIDARSVLERALEALGE